jgi:hypothetical protein
MLKSLEDEITWLEDSLTSRCLRNSCPRLFIYRCCRIEDAAQDVATTRDDLDQTRQIPDEYRIELAERQSLPLAVGQLDDSKV